MQRLVYMLRLELCAMRTIAIAPITCKSRVRVSYHRLDRSLNLILRCLNKWRRPGRLHENQVYLRARVILKNYNEMQLSPVN